MDGCVVVAAYAKCALCELLAILYVGLGTFFVEQFEQHAVLSLAGYDDYVLEVFRASSDE